MPSSINQYPTLSQWALRLQERTQPIQPDDASFGWVHGILCEALARPYEQIAELIDPPEPYPPWGPLFDIKVCPAWALPWLAQAVGVRIPQGMSDVDARALIIVTAGHNAGTPKAIADAVRTTLVPRNPPTPAQVWFRERDGSAYRFEMVTLDDETPNPDLTNAVLQAAKPGGLNGVFRRVEAWDYQAMTDRGGTYSNQSATYNTYSDLREDRPNP